MKSCWFSKKKNCPEVAVPEQRTPCKQLRKKTSTPKSKALCIALISRDVPQWNHVNLNLPLLFLDTQTGVCAGGGGVKKSQVGSYNRAAKGLFLLYVLCVHNTSEKGMVFLLHSCGCQLDFFDTAILRGRFLSPVDALVLKILLR